MNLRIRIADDEELIRKSLVKLLKAEGYEVDAVGTAAEVLESVRNDPPQILILDLRLVEYIETPGLRLLMTLNEELQAEGSQVRLVVRPGSRVERTLRLAGLDQQCAVFHTVREALSEPSGPAARASGPTRGGA